MGQVHDLIDTEGRETIREQTPPSRRRLIDSAADILADETQRIGITYSGFCLTALPHRRLADEEKWERSTSQVTLLVEPGHLRLGGKIRQIGVPFGARARLILIYLQTQAVKTGSPEVEMGRSLYAWLRRMDITPGGKAYEQVRDQTLRISACRLSFLWERDGRSGFEKDSIVQSGIHLSTANGHPSQAQLWEEVVRLSDSFFAALRAHPVPISDLAVRSLGNRSMAMDIYIWLAYRLHVLQQPTSVSWPALFHQFGAGFAALRQFKYKFWDALRAALAVYPEARVEEAPDGTGLLLFPSRPAIPERSIIRPGPSLAVVDGWPPRLTQSMVDQFRRILPDLDPDAMFADWLTRQSRDRPPADPTKAFLSWSRAAARR